MVPHQRTNTLDITNICSRLQSAKARTSKKSEQNSCLRFTGQELEPQYLMGRVNSSLSDGEMQFSKFLFLSTPQ